MKRACQASQERPCLQIRLRLWADTPSGGGGSTSSISVASPRWRKRRSLPSGRDGPRRANLKTWFPYMSPSPLMNFGASSSALDRSLWYAPSAPRSPAWSGTCNSSPIDENYGHPRQSEWRERLQSDPFLLHGSCCSYQGLELALAIPASDKQALAPVFYRVIMFSRELGLMLVGDGP